MWTLRWSITVSGVDVIGVRARTIFPGIVAGREVTAMSKREIIDRIMHLNRSARPEFLADFHEDDLRMYMEHLEAVADSPRTAVPTKSIAAA